jgi:hypothetical protein
MLDAALLQQKLDHHLMMVTKLENSHPELALIWLAGAELIQKQLASLGVGGSAHESHSLSHAD